MAKIGSGLANMGNTCFLNAVLQCLLHSPPLVKILQGRLHSKKCKIQGWCVFCELERIWRESEQLTTVEPKNLVRNLNKMFRKFRLGRQEDAHEFLRYFIEGLQKSDIDTKEKKPELIRQLTQSSTVFQIFGGKMKSSIRCLGCNAKSQITEHFYDMSLQCQQSNSVSESLEAFFRVDVLSGDNRYRCQSCKKLSNAHKRFLFSRLPLILTIQLKRFTNSLNKLNKFVKYDTIMNLAKYCDGQQKQPIYQLFGVVVHDGSSAWSGHYYSFIQTSDLKWYKMNDSWITKSNVQQVSSQRSYLLFYKAKQELLQLSLKSQQAELSTESVPVEQPTQKLQQIKKYKPQQQNNKKDKIYEKKLTQVNGVVQLIEKNTPLNMPPLPPLPSTLPVQSKPTVPIISSQLPMKKKLSFLEELQNKKKEHQPLLQLMEKYFSIEESKNEQSSMGTQQRKIGKSKVFEENSSEELDESCSPRNPLKRPRYPSHRKALEILRHYSRAVKRRRLQQEYNNQQSNQKYITHH